MIEPHHFWVFVSGVIINHCVRTNVLLFIIIMSIVLYIVNDDNYSPSPRNDYISTMASSIDKVTPNPLYRKPEQETSETNASDSGASESQDNKYNVYEISEKRKNEKPGHNHTSAQRQRLYEKTFTDLEKDNIRGKNSCHYL